MGEHKSSVLLIFTGGTISMGENSTNHSLAPLDTSRVLSFIPELEMLHVNISSVSFSPLIDSSDITASDWIDIATLIERHYNDFDGFVVLHGTDTMAYSASALSFMLDGLTKPVIFTGSQLPVGVLRSDAKENLITAIELAAAKDEYGRAMVPEVCLFFEDKLMRGNRTTKRNSEDFNAFASFNYPELVRTGVHIKYYEHNIHREEGAGSLSVSTHFDSNVVILKLFPGITPATVKAVYAIGGLRAVVLESYGSGNAPTALWLRDTIAEAGKRGVVTVNVSQCRAGGVEMGRYEASVNLIDAGVVSGRDMTTEAAVTKLMFLLGRYEDSDTVKRLMQEPLKGEMSY
ncbi:MAG: asparaginase [Candidatus Aphodosoma sp.]